mmetsp:Transcript_14967/g.31035  ORF Transcript_14967/g.31035 Transcript_14967/m.31035 type:complete len:252 (+) Transcript_14967:565-1320(+)
MNQDWSSCVWIEPLEIHLYRILNLTSRNTQDIVGFVDDYQPLVFVNNRQFSLRLLILWYVQAFHQRIGFHIGSQQYMAAQNRLAFSPTARIVISVRACYVALASVGGWAPPEFCECNRTVSLGKCVLKELDGGAIPGSRGRNSEGCVLEDLHRGFGLPMDVQEFVLIKELLLKIVRTIFALLFQVFYLGALFLEGFFNRLEFYSYFGLASLEFALVESTFLNKPVFQASVFFIVLEKVCVGILFLFETRGW